MKQQVIGWIVVFFIIGLAAQFREVLVADWQDHSDTSEEAVSYSSGFGRPFFDAILAKTWPVKIVFKRHALIIPRNYLTTFDRGTYGPFFILAMVLSDLHGLDEASLARMTRLLNVAAWWTNAPPDVVSAWNVDGSFSALDHFNGPTIADARKIAAPETQYGLVVLPKKYPHSSDNFVFLSKDDSEDRVIKCSESPILNGRTFCRVEFDLAQGLVMQYTYDVSLLPEWRTIDSKVRLRLASFLEQ